jgi:hypothetical protein
MSKRYEGLPEELRVEVLERDKYRCRWCGATNRGGDLHHIEYRRGYSYDRADNLITLCRLHHGFVHGTPLANGATITKDVAQQILKWLVEHPGATGASRWRQLKRQWALEARCEPHGIKKDECLDCWWETRNHEACVECGNDMPALGEKYCSDCLEALFS